VLGVPVDDRHDPGLHGLHALEEPGDLRAGTGPERLRGRDPDRFELRDGVRRQVVVRDVGQHQVAAGGQGGDQPGHDAVRVVLVGDEVQDRGERQGHRLGQIQGLAQIGIGEAPLRVAQVGVDVGGGSLGGAGQQRAGVDEHDRVVVDVHHARGGIDALGHLVQVGAGGDPGPDVEELADPGLLGQVPPDSRSAAKLSLPPSR
jgi:hypothetical protein